MSVTLTPQNAAQYGFTPPSGGATQALTYFTQSGQPTTQANAYFTAPSGGYSFNTPAPTPIETPSNVSLERGTLTPAQKEQTGSAKAVTLIDSLLGQASLPVGTTISPQLQNIGVNELMGTAGLTSALQANPATAPTAPTIAAPTAVTSTGATASAPQTASQIAAAQVAGTTPTATAAQGTVSQPMTAAQGAITPLATTQGQLESLQNQITQAVQSGNPLPVFARGAAKATEAAMANRGMSASSMAAEALAEGIMNSAIPIAKADADAYRQMIFQNLANNQQAALVNTEAYLKMDMANLSNRQQTNLQNINTRQTFLLSDQAAANAAYQFNATSQNQVNQFYDKLSTQISDQNAARSDAMNKFSSAEKNKIDALNAQNLVAVNDANAKREAAINEFNATLQNNRDQFNVENQREIDQSNVVWRRALNTANTAAVNAANQTNAQNLLNISNWALASAWQQWRDEASWVNTSSENAANRNHNLAMAALERSTALDLQDQQSKDALYELIGRFGFEVFNIAAG